MIGQPRLVDIFKLARQTNLASNIKINIIVPNGKLMSLLFAKFRTRRLGTGERVSGSVERLFLRGREEKLVSNIKHYTKFTNIPA